MDKNEWISFFRQESDRTIATLNRARKSRNEKASEVNRAIISLRDTEIEKIKQNARRGLNSKRLDGSTDSQIKNDQNAFVNEMLTITYASYIVMLEARNRVWPYEYMAFARRIGELWEPFCKVPFSYPVNQLKTIEPPNFEDVQNKIRKTASDYIDSLKLSVDIKQELKLQYSIPWTMVDSGGIRLALDLHFEQNGIHYNCDFKSGFSSNEKGNTNRLLLVASIYHSLGDKEKTMLFVRQREDENNHYLQTLKNSGYWDVCCADDCYAAMRKFTGYDIRKWLDENVDCQSDISKEFRKHLQDNDLLKYLTW